MNLIDLRQQKTINIITAVVGLLTVAVGVLAYMESKKHRKIQKEILDLDKQIKVLELSKLQKEQK